MKTVYLANPYGFSDTAKRLLLPPIVEALESLGLPQDSWGDYYYTSIEEIGDSNKALFKWLSGE